MTWKLIYHRYHIPNGCLHATNEFQDCGEDSINRLTQMDCLKELMRFNATDSCWRYVPMRFEEVRINKLNCEA